MWRRMAHKCKHRVVQMGKYEITSDPPKTNIFVVLPFVGVSVLAVSARGHYLRNKKYIQEFWLRIRFPQKNGFDQAKPTFPENRHKIHLFSPGPSILLKMF